MKLNPCGNKGFSLIEVMIAGVIMGIISLALMSMITSQRQELKSIGEKMLAFDVQSLVQRSVSNIDYCGCAFKGLTFDSTAKKWNAFPTTFPTSFDAACNPAATSSIQKGQPILSTTVKVKNLDMQNINEIVANSGNYIGQMVIELDPDTLVRPVRKIEVTMSFSVNTSDPLASQTFINCSADSAGGAGGWTVEVPTSGTVHKALGNGYIVATSAMNRGIKLSTGPTAGTMTEKAFISARDKYGQGRVELTVPISKNEFWMVESVDVSQGVSGDVLSNVYFKKY